MEGKERKSENEVPAVITVTAPETENLSLWEYIQSSLHNRIVKYGTTEKDEHWIYSLTRIGMTNHSEEGHS